MLRNHFFSCNFSLVMEKTAPESDSHNRKTSLLGFHLKNDIVYVCHRKIRWHLITSWCALFIEAKRVSCQNKFQFLEVSHIRSVWQLFRASRYFDDTKRFSHRVQADIFAFVSQLKVFFFFRVGSIYFVIMHIELGPIYHRWWRKSIPNMRYVWNCDYKQYQNTMNANINTRLARNTEIA